MIHLRFVFVVMLAALTAAAFAHVRTETPTALPQWWKGNTHTHTLWSDGNAAPEYVVDWYRQHGYHFLVLSDHNVLSRGERWFPISEETGSRLQPSDLDDLAQRFGATWVETRETNAGREMKLKTLEEIRSVFETGGEFVMIEGEEISDSFRRRPVHINAMNIERVIPPQGGETIVEVIQRNLDAVIAEGRRLGRPVLAHINHPNFQHALLPEDVAAIRGERFFEVYNGHRGVLNQGDDTRVSTEELWDIALATRLADLDLGLLYALATDDAHNHHGRGRTSTPGRGWIQVRASTLDADAIIDAMHAGDFYASTGVELRDFGRTDDTLWLEIVPEDDTTYTTEFIGTRRGGTPGEVLATSSDLRPSYQFTGDELYVRARVTSSTPHPNPFLEGDMTTAWVQPVVPLSDGG